MDSPGSAVFWFKKSRELHILNTEYTQNLDIVQ